MRATLLFALLPLLVPRPAADPDPRAINAALELGVSRLLEDQGFDGSWDYERGQWKAGANALCVYTLLKCGVSKEDHAVQRGLAWLEGASANYTYEVGCLLLALTTHDAEAHAERIEELAGKLLAWQNGGWGYPNGGDLSNTQYAALGLRAAALAGVEVPRISWLDLAEAVLEHASGDGGFVYSRGRVGKPTASMTAAGIGTLAIAREMLERIDGLPPKLGARMAEGQENGLAWLGRHWSVTENQPGGKRWLGYYLYGLERVGGLARVQEIAGHDWFREGARFLLRGQDDSGNWAGSLEGTLADTCFALLFLRRATYPVTGVDHRYAGKPRHASDLGKAGVQLTAAGDTPLGLWISGWRAEGLGGLAWPGEEAKGPRVQRVDYLADGELIARVFGDATQPAGDQRFEAQVEFPRPGKYSISANVLAVGPPHTDSTGRVWPGSPRLVESEAVLVEVRETVPGWMLDNARDSWRNVLRAAHPAIHASSSIQSHSASEAVDGDAASAWLCDPSDEAPWVELNFERPALADRIVLGHARCWPLDPGRFARAPFARIVINGKLEHRLSMHPDEAHKSRLVLPRALEIRSLEIHLPHRVAGRDGAREVGLSEVELQLVGED